MENKDGMINTPKIEKVTPTHVAQRCPVCNGFGTLKYGEKVCNGCEGKGYILVPAEPLPDDGRTEGNFNGKYHTGIKKT